MNQPPNPQDDIHHAYSMLFPITHIKMFFHQMKSHQGEMKEWVKDNCEIGDSYTLDVPVVGLDLISHGVDRFSLKKDSVLFMRSSFQRGLKFRGKIRVECKMLRDLSTNPG
jgi:hypothetical protein